jgi:hypothetical protein
MNDKDETSNQQQELPPSTAVSFTPVKKAVGGWLMFFCFGLTVLSPLVTLGSLVASYNETSQYFSEFTGLQVITVIDTLLSVGLMVFSIYSGVGLLRIRPGAVQMAKRYLLCLLGYLVVAAILPFLAGLPAEANNGMIESITKDTIRGVIYVAVWYLYLNMSKRVSDTYYS